MLNRVIKDVTEFIFMEDTPKKCDIIFIPGTSQSVVTERAAELYRNGYAPLIMPSGMYSTNFGKFAGENIDNPVYSGEYETEFEYCRNILTKNGVPQSAILKEDKATNTYENALYSLQALNEAGIRIKSAIVCCQAFHARRAFMSYSLCFENVEFIVVPTDTQGITKSSWHSFDKGYKKVFGELSKCGHYFKDMSGWIS